MRIGLDLGFGQAKVASEGTTAVVPTVAKRAEKGAYFLKERAKALHGNMIVPPDPELSQARGYYAIAEGL